MATKKKAAKKKAAAKSSESSVMKPGYAEKYEDGTCGDDMAALLAKSVKNEDGSTDERAIAKIAKDNGIDMEKYAKLNVGMQRMNLGNRLRGLVNGGTDIDILGKVVKGNPEAKKGAAEKEKRKEERAAKAKAKKSKPKAKAKAKRKKASPKK